MKDLTKGNPMKLVLQFALPLAIAGILQLAYNLTDTRIVGIYLGDDALTAVGATSTLSNLLIGFLNGLTNGFALTIAMCFGRKDYGQMRRAEGTTIVLGLMMSLVMTVVCVLGLPVLLKLLNVPVEHKVAAGAYIRIILLGLTASMMYNVCAAILRAIGDTITPLVFLLVSVVLNIGLDLLFICVFKWGVEGAAFATVMAQCISFICCLVYMWVRYPLLRLGLRDFKLQRELVQELLGSGISMGLMSSLVNFGTLALQTGINGLGDMYILAHTGARKVSEIFMMPFSVFGMTMATYCGQNYGAGRFGRIYEGIRSTIILSFVWCCGVVLCSYTIAPYLVRFVIATESQEIVEIGSLYLRMNTLLYMVCAVICIGRNALQGMGEHRSPVVSSFLELFGKCAAVGLLVPRFGYWGVIWAEPLSWVVMVVPLLASLVPRLIKYRRMKGMTNETTGC